MLTPAFHLTTKCLLIGLCTLFVSGAAEAATFYRPADTRYSWNSPNGFEMWVYTLDNESNVTLTHVVSYTLTNQWQDPITYETVYEYTLEEATYILPSNIEQVYGEVYQVLTGGFRSYIDTLAF